MRQRKFQTGDRVRVKARTLPVIYKVLGVTEDTGEYIIWPEDGKGPTHTYPAGDLVHADSLLERMARAADDEAD